MGHIWAHITILQIDVLRSDGRLRDQVMGDTVYCTVWFGLTLMGKDWVYSEQDDSNHHDVIMPPSCRSCHVVQGPTYGDMIELTPDIWQALVKQGEVLGGTSWVSSVYIDPSSEQCASRTKYTVQYCDVIAKWEKSKSRSNDGTWLVLQNSRRQASRSQTQFVSLHYGY